MTAAFDSEVNFRMDDLVAKVEQWGKDRKIIPNSTPTAQLLKAVSEMGELCDAEAKGDVEEVIDAVGDTLVCLILYCRLRDLDLSECLSSSYEVIRVRKGTLNEQGIFIKES